MSGTLDPAQEVGETVPAIEATNVEKVYGATVALAGANLVTRTGEIHGLLGENGAGKSTLVRILAGIERPDAGDVWLFGHPVGHAGAAGHAFIHQDLALFATMSVADNIALVGGFHRRLGLINERATVRRAQQVLDELSMRIDPRMLVGELPLADQTAVAIARALSRGVRLIVLDEPTAYLEARQVRNVLRLLQRLKNLGVACLLITHRADDVLTVCDRITVLRDGRTVESRPAAGLTERRLVELISGHAPSPASRDAPAARRDGMLRLASARSGAFGPLDLEVGVGEIVGLCGLADAGTTEVGKAIFGLTPLTGGELSFAGRAGAPRSPAEATRRGIAYVPPERRAAAIAESLTVRENLFMKPDGRWHTVLRSRQEQNAAIKLIEQLDVYPALPEQTISAFSGGNQQKIVLAKWLRNRPKLLILNEPTAGVDLSAKAQIHVRLRQMSAELSCGVLLISTDFGEVADLADRVYVMRRKQIVAEVPGDRATASQLVSLAYGGTES
jgi:ABC-type sugar transport system ATPase subunit